MIEFINVNKVFGKDNQINKVLTDINLTVANGDIFGIIGYSGAGKSTLVRLINMLEKPTTGEVLIDGNNLAHYDDKQIRQVKKKIGMIFQGFNLLETKTVAENIALPLLLNGVSKQERNKVVDELLEFVELSDKKFFYPNELSGGQKQRVSIARALANKPTILLCDEATSALDPQTTRSILDLLQRINREQNVTIVIVTHEMSVVKHICNNMIVMEHGKIVEHGAVIDLFKQPKSPVTQKFIGSVIPDKLPTPVRNHLLAKHVSNVYRFEFLGASAQGSVISQAILKANGKMQINILFSNMINIKEEVIGYMFASIEGEQTYITDTISYLKQQDVRIAKLNEDGNYVWI
ncbi:ATP-binding cassette domain-containing protein [Orbus sturtevantii]|uniref:methionine ABC transporter ATP-binding protein n=1 Tax=Orbus sturtevantii TaxID=3074109 RepID=UPI00370D4D25